VPVTTLGFLTSWPAGLTRPLAATLNSLDGRIKSNAAIVPAGTGGTISIYASDATQVILDINGYFAPNNYCRRAGVLSGCAVPAGGHAQRDPVKRTFCRRDQPDPAHSFQPLRRTFGGASLLAEFRGGGDGAGRLPDSLSDRLDPSHSGPAERPFRRGRAAASMCTPAMPPASFGFLTLWPQGIACVSWRDRSSRTLFQGDLASRRPAYSGWPLHGDYCRVSELHAIF
jgi:hypothetical protein